MNIPNRVDLDRLHRAVQLITSDEFRGRGEGKTFAYINLMAGEVALGDPGNVYLYLGENHQHAIDVGRTFVEFVNDFWDLDILTFKKHDSSARSTIKHHDQRFIFMGVDGFDCCRFRGMRLHRIFFDVSTETQSRLEQSGRFAELSHTVIPALFPHGDIV